MFFIFGAPRSGTTLLARMLAAHPQLAIPHETDCLVPMAFLCDRIRDPALGRRMVADLVLDSSGFAASLGEVLSRADVEDAIASAPYEPARMADAIYARFARHAGAEQAGDKSPNDLNFIRILDKTGFLAAPNKVVHLVRDVRDVMASLLRTGWGGDIDRYFPRQWCHVNLYLQAAMAGQDDRYLLIRYEDLVNDPASELGRACRLLGVPFSPALLEPSARDHARYRGQEVHRNLAQPISTDGIGRFRDTLDAARIAAYERQAGEALGAFGYTTG